MIKQLFINPTEKTIKTNILKCLIEEQPLEEIKQIIEKLEKVEFDLTRESIIFEGIEYGVIKTEQLTAVSQDAEHRAK